MSPEEARRFLRAGTRSGKLAVVRRDGRPMVVPIWFDLDEEGRLLVTTGAETVKGRALRRDPRVSVCVDVEAPPYDYVRIDGTAEIDDLDLVRLWATRLGARYMGAERGEEFGRRNGVPGELLVRVTPAAVIGRAGIAD